MSQDSGEMGESITHVRIRVTWRHFIFPHLPNPSQPNSQEVKASSNDDNVDDDDEDDDNGDDDEDDNDDVHSPSQLTDQEVEVGPSSKLLHKIEGQEAEQCVLGRLESGKKESYEICPLTQPRNSRLRWFLRALFRFFLLTT